MASRVDVHGPRGAAATPAACRTARLRRLLSAECGVRAAEAAKAEAQDSRSFQAVLHALQHPTECSSRRVVTFKDWRNGLGAQLSSIVGAWAAQLGKMGSFHPDAQTDGRLPPLLVPLGGLRYANKARCAKRDLACYFTPMASCAPPTATKSIRAAKTPAELASRVSADLHLSRPRDKWWLRKELTRYIFQPNAALRAMLQRVRSEMKLMAPRDRGPSVGDSAGEDSAKGQHAGEDSAGAHGAAASDALAIDELVAVHVRRGDKRDLGAKERGEPFSDAMYVSAALALADELGAKGFLLASSEPETLRRLPEMLRPRPTFVMPAHYFVQVSGEVRPSG